MEDWLECIHLKSSGCSGKAKTILKENLIGSSLKEILHDRRIKQQMNLSKSKLFETAI